MAKKQIKDRYNLYTQEKYLDSPYGVYQRWFNSVKAKLEEVFPTYEVRQKPRTKALGATDTLEEIRKGIYVFPDFNKFVDFLNWKPELEPVFSKKEVIDPPPIFTHKSMSAIKSKSAHKTPSAHKASHPSQITIKFKDSHNI